jgi:hypothetical protein
VEYASADEARYAIASLHDTELQGRLILVRQDKDDGRQALSQPQYPPVLPPIGPYNMGNMGNMGSLSFDPLFALSTASAHVISNRTSWLWNVREMESIQHDEPNSYVATASTPTSRSSSTSSTTLLVLHSFWSSCPSIALSSPLCRESCLRGECLYLPFVQIPFSLFSSPPQVTWQELKDHMRSAGEVIRVDLKMAPDGVR